MHRCELHAGRQFLAVAQRPPHGHGCAYGDIDRVVVMLRRRPYGCPFRADRFVMLVHRVIMRMPMMVMSCVRMLVTNQIDVKMRLPSMAAIPQVAVTVNDGGELRAQYDRHEQ